MDWESDPELKAIRKEFIDSFKERKETLQLLIRELKKIGDNPASFGARNMEKFYFITHKLAGTAESYDFPTLTKISAAIEKLLLIIKEPEEHEGKSPSTEELIRFTELLIQSLKTAMKGDDPVESLSDPIFVELAKRAS